MDQRQSVATSLAPGGQYPRRRVVPGDGTGNGGVVAVDTAAQHGDYSAGFIQADVTKGRTRRQRRTHRAGCSPVAQ